MSFDKFVATAPKVLFHVGVVLAALGFLAQLVPGVMSGDLDRFLLGLFGGILNSLQMVLLPWIAAAALWRFDKFLEGQS